MALGSCYGGVCSPYGAISSPYRREPFPLRGRFNCLISGLGPSTVGVSGCHRVQQLCFLCVSPGIGYTPRGSYSNMLLRSVLRRRLVKGFEEGFLEVGVSWKVLRRQKHTLSQSTTPSACTLFWRSFLSGRFRGCKIVSKLQQTALKESFL